MVAIGIGSPTSTALMSDGRIRSFPFTPWVEA